MTRILLVEDDPVTQDIVRAILKSRGYGVDAASDGFAAVGLLRECSYAVTLVDYHLPEMDGYALARLMRDICGARHESLHLIGMTADRHGLAGRRGVDRVFDDILAKPFAPNDLLGLIEKVLPRSGQQDTVAAAAAALMARPVDDQARNVSRSLWRAHGLADLPKVHVVPAPTSDQADAIRICFEIVDEASADLLLIVNALGFHDLIRARASAAAHLPIVTLDRALSIIADGHFAVEDTASWAATVNLLQRHKASGAAGAVGEAAVC